jgi:hypothetical protein
MSRADQLNALTVKELVTIFNRVTGSNVKRFASKTAGIKRIEKAAVDATVGEQLTIELTVGAVGVAIVEEAAPYDDGTPLATAAEVVTKVARKNAEKAGKDVDKPRPIEGSTLVVFRGKIIRPDSVAAVKKGVALCGACSAKPSKIDALKGEHAKVNLNYAPKERIVPVREGTQRAQLIALMTDKGVTIEQVAKLFGISEQAAIYKIRDLAYVGGHGLKLKKGRVFAYGE